jgi:Ca-activated chloride channel homolog
MRPALMFAAIVVAWSAGALCAQDPPVAPARFVSASADLVVVPVVVTDRKDRFVAGLSQDQFALFDNGRPQPVALFTAEDTPVTVGLVIDSSGSMRPRLADVRAAALAFSHSSNPHDELFAVAFNDSVIDGLGGSMLLVSDHPALERALDELTPIGRTALYDGISASLRHVASGTRPRKVLILISDGGDNASAATLKEVLASARASNVTIYTIGLFDADDPDTNPGVLKSLAEATGGERFLPRSPSLLRGACEHIAREIRSGYTIAYVPPDRDGAYHRIRVDVKTGGRVSVRTRPGYVAATPVASR